MTDISYEAIVAWLYIAAGLSFLIGFPIYLLVRGGTRSPAAHNDNDDSEIWGDASLYGTESRHE